MKIFAKIRRLLSWLLIGSCLVLHPMQNLDEEKVQKFVQELDRAWENMSEEQREQFAMEIQREQERIMKMSPAEREEYENFAAQQLDQVLNSNYFEDLVGPQNRPETAPPAKDTVETEPVEQPVETSAKPAKPASKSGESQKRIISTTERQQIQSLVNNLLSSIDLLLLKLQDLKQQASTSYSEFQKTLKTLKSCLTNIIIHDKALAKFLQSEQQRLRQALSKLNNLLISWSERLKSPDVMRLSSNFDGHKQIDYRSTYQQGHKQLQTIVNEVSDFLRQHKVIASLQELIDPAARNAKHNRINVELNISNKKRLTRSLRSQQPVEVKQIENLVHQFSELSGSSWDNMLASIKQTGLENKLNRRIKWRLSELLVCLNKLVTMLHSAANLSTCQAEIKRLLQASNLTNSNLRESLIYLKNTSIDSEANALIIQIETKIDEFEGLF